MKGNTYMLMCLIVSMPILFFVSCLDEITLDNPDNTLNSIAITGKLVYGSPTIVRVNISDLSDFVAQDAPVPISGADVVLENQAGQSIDIPMVSMGVYQIAISLDNPNFSISPGDFFNINVEIPELGKYQSSPEQLHAVPGIAGIRKNAKIITVLDELENIDTSYIMELAVNTPLQSPLNNEKSLLTWELSGTYKFRESALAAEPRLIIDLCYFTDPLSINKIPLFDGRSTDQSELIDFNILEEALDYRFNSGFYLLIIQQSLSEGAYRYWDQINQVIDRNGSFFETPPAKVIGNFKDLNDPDREVFGYFHAVAHDSLRVFISPQEARFPSPLCKGVQTRDEYVGLQAECRDCLRKPGSTLVLPKFWID